MLTYDFIIRELWGPKAKTDNQILRVNMANIRRKIEDTPGQPQYIFTEVGVGYMPEGDWTFETLKYRRGIPCRRLRPSASCFILET